VLLTNQSKEIRRQILTEAYKQKHGHIASCFSCVEILLAIKEVAQLHKDYFILSKGHAVLAERAVFGTDISCYKTGSLGHGIGVGCGIALSKPDSNVYVVVGDGELQEGSCWESLQFMFNNPISNLYVFIDSNGYQASQKIPWLHMEEILSEGSYDIEYVDGSDIKEILEALAANHNIINCLTRKGEGVSFMEQDPVRFHTEIPSEILYNQALKELE
jgi:transketolase